jgi:hypothetical protein
MKQKLPGRGVSVSLPAFSPAHTWDFSTADQILLVAERIDDQER